MINKFVSYKYLIYFIMAIGLILRIIDINADTPFFVESHYIYDEGGWAHNARNYYKYNEWASNNHDGPFYTAPGYSIILYLSFLIGGLFLSSARMVSAIAGTATIFMLWVFLLKKGNVRIANIGSIFITFAGIHIIYSRLIMTETLITMFVMLAILLWSFKNRWICAFLGGVILGSLLVIKISSLYYMPVFFLLFIAELIRKEASIKSILIFMLGSIMIFVGYGYLFVIPRLYDFIYWNYSAPSLYMEGISYKYLLDLYLFNIMEGNELTLYNKIFSSIPMLFILSYIILSTFLVRTIDRWKAGLKELSYIEVVGISIIVGSMVMINLSSLRPERRYIPVLLGIIMLVSWGIDKNNISERINQLFKWRNSLKVLFINVIINLPMFSYVIMLIYSIMGNWEFVNVGRIKGISFHGQAIILFPIYFIIMLLMAIRKREIDPKKMIIANSLLLVCQIIGVWLYYIMLFYGKVLTLWELVVSVGLLCGALSLIWKFIFKGKIKNRFWFEGGSFIIVQAILISFIHINPTFSYENLGKGVERITQGSAIITGISGPLIHYPGKILYEMPNESIIGGNDKKKYILNWERVGTVNYGVDAFNLLGKEEKIGRKAKFIKGFSVLPYGEPSKRYFKFNLWEMNKE